MEKCRFITLVLTTLKETRHVTSQMIPGEYFLQSPMTKVQRLLKKEFHIKNDVA